jgi:hypothetical protein
VRPAPPLALQPTMAGQKKKHKVKDDECQTVGEFRINDERAEKIIRDLRMKWGLLR